MARIVLHEVVDATVAVQVLALAVKLHGIHEQVLAVVVCCSSSKEGRVQHADGTEASSARIKQQAIAATATERILLCLAETEGQLW